ncbi:hypothetical protein [Streptomyces sp. A0592]|uniref:hypothetical protein n=1 Tax=Streptomyces sp. A0592 TaxID=2563099 RepID=UPI00109E4FA2|nr:hypothetical protein [Streptomyces sp. A0592]THA81222.1 hypothetical protein E6U81_25655 [Streptomyces sp. A0592]
MSSGDGRHRRVPDPEAGSGRLGEDTARLSPLKTARINFLGRYLFNIAASGPAQGLRRPCPLGPVTGGQ